MLDVRRRFEALAEIVHLSVQGVEPVHLLSAHSVDVLDECRDIQLRLM